MVLTNAIYKEKLENLSKLDLSQRENAQQSEILAIDDESSWKQLVTQPKLNPERMVSSSNLAYIIYTSGTTGNPKGVLQFHSNIVRLFTATDDWYNFNNK